MGSKVAGTIVLGGLLLVVSARVQGARTEYIQVSSDNVNIRAKPTTGAEVVGKAQKGDIFELEGVQGSWYRIHLFSRDSRYIHRSLATLVPYQVEVPDELSVRRQVYRAWLQAGQRARREADERYSPDRDLLKNLELYQLLVDRYRLEVLQEFRVQVPAYRRIILEGNQIGWQRDSP